ncbi:M20 family metallopeptidase [Paenibacillus sp. NEAU-GSW1]|uniref:M20 metallopeptidase family protein n=1 Tax=Paenibacillus sp. NEAU-GSW1 TaxID=2682486 RepID=UPI0012E1679A|nr:amidohydrolase [Paenibacillus sp. NEAU-GSW1]MUT67194.1 amidohydrolase [Paenibacillus sp. NEAU-GSW1]
MELNNLFEHIEGNEAELIELRRSFHRDPELLFDVDRTAAKVAELLEGWGLEVKRGAGNHFGKGVVATLQGIGGGIGRTVLLRADMDALPIAEQTEAEYRSRREGVMHACGHDAHMAMLLGAAKAFARHRDKLRGTIKFVFQPAEEGAVPSPLDGRLVSGGRDLVESGVLDGVDACFALHVWPELPVGTIGVHPAYAMAASSHFTVTFQGVAGHHSSPHLAVDAIMMASQFIQEMKAAMATVVNPLEPAVLAFGTLKAGAVINAIAADAEIRGTYRAYNPEVVEQVRSLIVKRSQAIAESFGGSSETLFRIGTALRNDEHYGALARRAGAVVAGEDNAISLQSPSLAGEDFALYTERVPGAFAFLGVGNTERGIVHSVHHPQFELDERALVIGAKLHAAWAAGALEGTEKK